MSITVPEMEGIYIYIYIYVYATGRHRLIEREKPNDPKENRSDRMRKKDQEPGLGLRGPQCDASDTHSGFFS